MASHLRFDAGGFAMWCVRRDAFSHVTAIVGVWAVVAVSALEVAAYDGVIAEGAKGRKIVERVKQLRRDAGFSGAVLAAEGGKVIAAVAVGESDGQPLTPESLFEIASCTKSFTAVAVMKLVEEGKLHLDDPIKEYLPGVPDDCSSITVRHLLQHTSGIPGTNTQGSGTDLAAVLPTFLEGGPRTTPGERHEYWNQGYALLSEIIARAARKPYTVYCRDAIFSPCQMKATRFTGQHAPRGAMVSVGTSTRGAPRSALEHPYGEYGFQYRGMGGLATSLVDLWKFDRTLARGKLLSKKSIDAMTAPGPGGYALGWRLSDVKPGQTVHSHTGSVRGFLASITRDPQLDGALFVLANSDDAEPFDRVCRECTEILWDLESDDGSDSDRSSALVGKYRDQQGRTLTVRRDGRRIAARFDWGGPKSDGFLVPGNGETWSFAQNRGGKLTPMNTVRIERGNDQAVTGVTITDLQPPLTFERVD